MSSRQTWERRVIAGLLKTIDTEQLSLIDGLVVDEDGSFTFSHEALTETEAERVRRSVEAVREGLTGVYTRLGGSRPEEGSGAGAGDEHDEPEPELADPGG